MDNQNDNLNIVIARLDQKVTDLSAQLGRQVTELQGSIKSLETNSISRINDLFKDKADSTIVDILQKKVNDDIEIRLRNVESKMAYYVGGIVILAGITEIIIKLWK